jgi:hypothetical protein
MWGTATIMPGKRIGGVLAFQTCFSTVPACGQNFRYGRASNYFLFYSATGACFRDCGTIVAKLPPV